MTIHQISIIWAFLMNITMEHFNAEKIKDLTLMIITYPNLFKYLGHLKPVFPFVPNGKLMGFRCPNIRVLI